MPPRKTLKISSWNVNGLRAAAKKGFGDWLASARSPIIGLQEVRALPEQLPEEVRTPKGYHADFFPAQRKGYSGVALYSRDRPDRIERSMGVAEYDAEGRYQSARFGALRIVNCYFPNGGGKNRDNSRVPFKLDFYRHLFEMLEEEKERGGRIVVMGDFNTAVEEIDLARPRQNTQTTGFLPEERAELRRWLAAGWVDSFRQLNDEGGHYTWWSQRAGAREKNIGWRIDYHLLSPAALPFLRSARITPRVMGSDHCPLEIVLEGGVLAA